MAICIWGDKQAEEVQELLLLPEKTNVWCGLWVGAIIKPYLFKTEASQNGDCYRTIMKVFLEPEIGGLDDNWFNFGPVN